MQLNRRGQMYFAIYLTCCFLVLLAYFRQDDRSAISFHTSGHGTKLDHEEYSPILGTTEDATRLYWPGTRSKLLPVLRDAKPPAQRPRTPLFIAFTNNNAMLQQAILAYIAAGWPPEDIIVVENTPTMDSNSKGELTVDDYFYLDHARLRQYGVSILQTPVLFTFAQLQNFFLRTAMAQGWRHYFWSHMDVVAMSDETKVPFRSLYQRTLDVLANVQHEHDWAIKWFACGIMRACDQLVLVNVETWRKIGGWDTFVPYYYADCDAFSRMAMHGYPKETAGAFDPVGFFFDVRTTLDDPRGLLVSDSVDEQLNSQRHQKARKALEDLDEEKRGAKGDVDRNEWQEHDGKQKSTGDWSYDPRAFRAGWWSTSNAGKTFYEKKWGTSTCELESIGAKTLDDIWAPLFSEQAKLAAEKERPTKLKTPIANDEPLS